MNERLNPVFVDYKRIHLLSDIHFGVRSNSIEWTDNIVHFFNNFYIPYLKDNYQDGDMLCFLGDFFDSRQLLDINVMNVAIETVIKLTDILPVTFILGNHDLYKKFDTDINSLAAFRFIPNVTIIDVPTIITNNKNSILCLPWSVEFERDEKIIESNNIDYVFAHTDMAGFSYDNGKEIKKGVNFMNKDKLKLVFSGHIHRRQEKLNKFIYLGSPYHTKRSDIGNKKGVYLFEPDQQKYNFTVNHLSAIFQKVKIDDLLEFTLEEAKDLFRNNYTDIVVSEKYINLFNLSKFIDILKDCKYKKIEAITEVKREDTIDSDVVTDIKDILTLLEMSIDELNHDMEILVKVKLLNKKYYNKANKSEEEII